MSEEIIDTVETTTIDAVEAASTVVTSATDEVAGTPWYKRFWSWLCGKAQKLYTLVMPAVKTAVTTFLNDSTNQTLAIAAVKAAIDQGLRGDKAWVTARDALVAQLETSGKSVANTLIDTLLQTAYCAVKYSVGATSEQTSD